MGFCNSLGQILRDFSGWTSAHGIPHIGSAQVSVCLAGHWGKDVWRILSADKVTKFFICLNQCKIPKKPETFSR